MYPGVTPKAFPTNKVTHRYHFNRPGGPKSGKKGREAKDFKMEKNIPLQVHRVPSTTNMISKTMKDKEMSVVPGNSIPSLLMPPGNISKKSSHILVYFHANAEDIKQSYPLLNYIRNALGIWILAMEYPGYGIYNGEANEAKVLQDALSIIQWLKNEVLGSTNEKPFKNFSKIILMGRSLGSGITSYIADHYPVGAVILISPFTSIKAVVKNMFGAIGSALVKERFNNLERIKTIKSPILIIHGKKDKIIPHTHGE